MADELENELNQPSESEKRIRQLSGKVKEEADAKDAALKEKAAAEAKAAEAEKKAAFAEGFADIVSTNPAAKDFKADIQAKVLSGYSVEDATFAVLGKAGKLGNQSTETKKTDETASPAGGSASYAPPQGGSKPIKEMTQAERLAALQAAEASGDLSMS